MTRRSLLLSTLSAATLADVANAQQHAKSANLSNAAFRYLNAGEASEIEALVAQIIPSDGTPGAKEAGCIHFIDRALETFDRLRRELYRSGLAATQEKRLELFPQSRGIAELNSSQAIALLMAIEQTEFFGLLRIGQADRIRNSPKLAACCRVRKAGGAESRMSRYKLSYPYRKLRQVSARCRTDGFEVLLSLHPR